MQYCCSFCSETYSKKIFYTRHVILCEQVYKSKQQRKQEDEEYEFSNPENAKITLPILYNIVLELAFKNNKLEKKIEEMQRHLNIKKRKLDICKWLQKKDNNNQMTNFRDWISQIEVCDENVEILQQGTVYQSICSIFDKNRDTMDCITCFNQKTNVFFVFTNRADEYRGSSAEWKRMKSDEFLLFLKYIHQKMVRAMCVWYSKKKDQMNDQQTILYNDAVTKLMKAEFESETNLVSKLRVYLYNKIKTDIPSDAFDFEFE